MNIFVLDQNKGQAKSFIGFENKLPEAYVASDYIDESYPIKNLFDGLDNTEFSTSDWATGREVSFTWFEPQDINYFGVVSKNGSAASISMTVEWLNEDDGIWRELGVISFLRDAQPYSKYYGDDSVEGKYRAKAIRVTIDAAQKPFIMAMYCGIARTFERKPSLGFQPAETSPIDQVSTSFARGNNFIGGVRRSLGFECIGSFDYIEVTSLESWLHAYQDHVLDSMPLFFTMDNENPHKSFYGRQDPKSMAKITYKTSFLSSFNFNMKGYA